jgi:hypothetical protein
MLSIGLATLLSMSLGFLLLVSTGQDDAYIAFWPAYTLAQFGEILNYNGERVEQGSSLLHTLVLAASIRTTGITPPTAGYWIGVIAGILAMLRASTLCARMGEPPSFALLLLIGTCPAFLYWCFGGLETPLVAWLFVEVALVAAGLIKGELGAWSARVVLVSFAFVAVRPEGAMVLASTLIVWLGLHGWCHRGGLVSQANPGSLQRWLLLVVILFAALCLFRFAYFGLPVPQPVAAKIGSDSLERIGAGVDYLTRLVRRPWASTLALVLAILPLVLGRELRRPRTDWVNLFAWLLVGACAAFILFAGGDWMKGARFIVHFAPVGIVLGYLALRTSTIPARWASALVVLLILSQLAGLSTFVFDSPGRHYWEFSKADPVIQAYSGDEDYSWHERANRIRTRDILFLAEARETLERVLEQQDRAVVMSGQAGMVFYYLAKEFYGRVEFVDRFGLSTTHLCRVRDELGLRSGRTGFKLSMDRYLTLGKQRPEAHWSPDLIFDIFDTREEVEAFDYRIVQVTEGASYGPVVRIGSRGFQRGISVFQYLALKEEVASRLNLPADPTVLDWTATRTAGEGGRLQEPSR